MTKGTGVAVFVALATTAAACAAPPPAEVASPSTTGSAAPRTTEMTAAPMPPVGATPGTTTTTMPDSAPATTVPMPENEAEDGRVVESLPVAPETEDMIRAISRFVERERGLAFKEEVAIQLLGEEDFIATYTKASEDPVEDDDGFEGSELILTVLGLLEDMEPGTTLEAEYDEFTELAVLGYYDTDDDVLVIRSEELTPHARGVLAHELTHALDDQWFELYRPELDEAGADAEFAFLALVEGDARRIEDAYTASRPQPERDAADAESESISETIDEVRIPEVFIELIIAPYVYGQGFVDQLLAIGGQRLLDEAFEHPPISSEQIFDVQAYRNGVVPVPVTIPPAEGSVFDSGVVGQHLLFVITGEVLGYGRAVPLVRGWAGDAYVAWHGPDGATCVRIDVAGDGADESDALRRALTEWAATQPDAAVADAPGGNVRLTACR